MGLLNLFRFGKVLLGTAQAIRRQRQSAADLRALPTPDFVAACLTALNAPAAPWHGTARPPATDVDALADAVDLPGDLRDFYRVCDGFESDSEEFPGRIHRLRELRTGADRTPGLSGRLARYWTAHGHDAEQPDMIKVLPPDSLTAIVTADAACHVPPAVLDGMTLLGPPGDHEFTVIALRGLSDQLPAGSVLAVEAGGATLRRFPPLVVDACVAVFRVLSGGPTR